LKRNNMIIIQNEFLTACFVEKGAELKSLVFNGTEYIWPGDEKIWALSAPLLFPICGGLKDDSYFLDGKKYHMQKHGPIRFVHFSVEEKSEDQVTFVSFSSEESKRNYPFDYKLSIIYKLEEKTLSVRYKVENTGEDTMYFSIGAHEGYFCPEGIEEYEVILPSPETLNSSVLEGNVLSDEKKRVITDSNRIPLKYEDYVADALVFEQMRAKSVVLQNKTTKRALKLSFKDFDYFLLWTKPGAHYICMEPWCGIGDHWDTTGDIKTKKGIKTLSCGGVFTVEHCIEILN